MLMNCLLFVWVRCYMLVCLLFVWVRCYVGITAKAFVVCLGEVLARHCVCLGKVLRGFLFCLNQFG